MDSTFIASNIRELSRLQLLVEVLQRVWRMLNRDDQERYEDDFAPYLKGTSGQYTYRIRASESGEHLQRIGELMQRLEQELAVTYANEDTYRILKRVFREHFVVNETDSSAPSSAPSSSPQGGPRAKRQQPAIAR